jgi:hypothetical protein
MDLQQLINEATPGSIWMRTDGSRARVIAITNLSLPAESQQKYVPVVVYIGPSGKVFSRPLKDFAGYFPTWLGHDAGAEKTIKSLLTPLTAPTVESVASSEDDSIDMSDDAPSAPAATRAKPAVQVREKVTASPVPAPAPNLLRSAFQVSADESRKTVSTTAEQLSRALRMYSQVPDEHLGLVVHKLSFELSPNLTIINLMEIFAPDDWVNTVDAFRIGTPVSDETVSVSAYMGVYPEYTRNVLYGTVYIGVDMIPVNNQLSIQEHVYTGNEASHTSAPDEVQPEVVSPKPEETPVPSADPVDEAPLAEEVTSVEAPTPAAEPVSQPESGTVGVQAIQEGAVVAESGSPEPEAPTQPVKVRKKRGPKKKVVEPVPVADDDLDVESLS